MLHDILTDLTLSILYALNNDFFINALNVAAVIYSLHIGWRVYKRFLSQ